MSLARLLLGVSPLLLAVVLMLPQHQVCGLFIWPRLVPYYYPLPVSSSSSSMAASASSTFPSSVHSGGTQYLYDWNSYNQNYPHSSSVLFPSGSSSAAAAAAGGGSSAEQSSMMPTSGGGGVLPSIGHSPFSGLSRWFHKPWLTWKLAKFGKREAVEWKSSILHNCFLRSSLSICIFSLLFCSSSSDGSRQSHFNPLSLAQFCRLNFPHFLYSSLLYKGVHLL